MAESIPVSKLIRMLGSMNMDSACRVDYAPSFTDDDGALCRRAIPMVTVTFFAHRYRDNDVGENTFHEQRKRRQKRR